MDIIIHVPDLADNAGTLSHTLAYLQKVQLHLQNTTRGNIGLYAKSSDGQFDEIVAMYAPDADERIRVRYVDQGGGYFAPWPGRTEAAGEGVSFFGPLTPAAYELVEGFLTQCVTALKTAVETDGLGRFYTVKIDIS